MKYCILFTIATVFRLNEDQTILTSIKTCSVAGDIDGVETYLSGFQEHATHLQEVFTFTYILQLLLNIYGVEIQIELGERLMKTKLRPLCL
jgi:hypothetical protein